MIRDTSIDPATASEPAKLAQALTRFMGDVVRDISRLPVRQVQWHTVGGGAVAIPAGGWTTYDFLCDFEVRPRAVLPAEAYVLDASGKRDSTTRLSAWGVDWEFVVKNGKPHIRLWGAPGLAVSKTYSITVLVVKE